jgi:exonuclease VII small subunit
MAVYDRIGGEYGAIRRADRRIAEPIWRALGDARSVINVGARAGSYEPSTGASQRALAEAVKHTAKERPRVEEQLASTRAEISRVERKLDRYFEAFETGELSAALCQERVRGHRERLEALRGQEADLGAPVGRTSAYAVKCGSPRRPRRPSRRHPRQRKPRGSERASPPAHEGDPRAQPPPNRPDLSGSGGGSRNTFKRWS